MDDEQRIPMKTIHADGFMFHSNPSPTGGGYTLVNCDGTLLERQEILKPGITNNETELLAVLRAAELSRPGGTILTDSQVSRTWVRKGRAKGRPDLNPSIERCKDLVRAKKLVVRFIPREKNLAGLYNERQFVGNPNRIVEEDLRRDIREEIADHPNWNFYQLAKAIKAKHEVTQQYLMRFRDEFHAAKRKARGRATGYGCEDQRGYRVGKLPSRAAVNLVAE